MKLQLQRSHTSIGYILPESATPHSRCCPVVISKVAVKTRLKMFFRSMKTPTASNKIIRT